MRGLRELKWDHDSGRMEYPTGYGTSKGYEVADDNAALQVFRIAAKYGLNIGVHAENMALVARITGGIEEGRPHGLPCPPGFTPGFC